MSRSSATAPGKIILFGEHAVVYGRPAIAAPVSQVRAQAEVADSLESGIRLYAPDLGRDYRFADAELGDPFARTVRVFLDAAALDFVPDLTITVRSTIPIASGLGSGAAMAAAVIRALSRHMGTIHLSADGPVSEMTYQVEQLLHGTPSGIDNTVVAYERPVYFRRCQPQDEIEMLDVGAPIHLLIADTGEISMTREVVGDVRRRWGAERRLFEELFDGCGQIALSARALIESGVVAELGPLMDQNQLLLEKMTVSSAALERLIQAARGAGALGAKLSGAGRGGNMIALVDEYTTAVVRDALLAAGARSVIASTIRAANSDR